MAKKHGEKLPKNRKIDKIMEKIKTRNWKKKGKKGKKFVLTENCLVHSRSMELVFIVVGFEYLSVASLKNYNYLLKIIKFQSS